MNRVVVILGATATGKTALAVDLARRLGGEIICGDSMTVYRGMDIGTAKPTLAERGGVAHHLVDILPPAAAYSVHAFQRQATALIASLNAAGKLPVVAGGTALYLRALLEGYDFNAAGGDREYRRHLADVHRRHGAAWLHDMLAAVDPATAARLHVNDVRRVTRALEVQHLGGEPISQRRRGLLCDAHVIGLRCERATLYERINRRVDDMMARGLLDEVRALNLAANRCRLSAAIGYRELLAHLDGELSLPDAVELIKRDTRRFAKRQLTWYRRMPYIVWHDFDEPRLCDHVCAEVRRRFAP